MKKTVCSRCVSLLLALILVVPVLLAVVPAVVAAEVSFDVTDFDLTCEPNDTGSLFSYVPTSAQLGSDNYFKYHISTTTGGASSYADYDDSVYCYVDGVAGSSYSVCNCYIDHPKAVSTSSFVGNELFDISSVLDSDYTSFYLNFAYFVRISCRWNYNCTVFYFDSSGNYISSASKGSTMTKSAAPEGSNEDFNFVLVPPSGTCFISFNFSIMTSGALSSDSGIWFSPDPPKFCVSYSSGSEPEIETPEEPEPVVTAIDLTPYIVEEGHAVVPFLGYTDVYIGEEMTTDEDDIATAVTYSDDGYQRIAFYHNYCDTGQKFDFTTFDDVYEDYWLQFHYRVRTYEKLTFYVYPILRGYGSDDTIIGYWAGTSFEETQSDESIDYTYTWGPDDLNAHFERAIKYFELQLNIVFDDCPPTAISCTYDGFELYGWTEGTTDTPVSGGTGSSGGAEDPTDETTGDSSGEGTVPEVIVDMSGVESAISGMQATTNAGLAQVNGSINAMGDKLQDGLDDVQGAIGDMSSEVNQGLDDVQAAVGGTNDRLDSIIGDGTEGDELETMSGLMGIQNQQIDDFNRAQQDSIDTGLESVFDSLNLDSWQSFVTPFSFVQHYVDKIFAGFGSYSIVYTLPLFLGLFFYMCSRVPNVSKVTRQRAEDTEDPFQLAIKEWK